MPRHEFMSVPRRSVAACPPGAGPGRRLPARGRLGSLCLALLCALPVSSGAVEQEEVTPEKENEPVTLRNNQRLVVPPGFEIKPKNVAGGTRDLAVLGGTDVGLDNKGDIEALNAFFADSIFEVLNSGTISGFGGPIGRVSNARTYGIRANAGNITRLENNTGGLIRGQYAVSATGHIGTLTNEGRRIFSNAFTNNVTGAGVEAGSIGTLTNRSVLEGTYRAILVYGNINELNNKQTGQIFSNDGEQGNAIVFGSIGTLTNAGSITAKTFLIRRPENGSALKGRTVNSTIGTLNNLATGTITGLATAIQAGAITKQLTNEKGGTIQGGTNHAAIHLASRSITSGTLTNHGTIKGGAHGLLSVSPIKELTNEKDGLIEGGTGAAVDVQGITTLNNRGGRIISTSSDGIKAKSIGTLRNSDGGEISGAKAGVKAEAIGTLRNAANSTIKGGAAKTSGNIGVSVSGTLGLLENSGSISGGAHGVEAGTITRLVNNKDGTISGDESGVDGQTIVELINSGTIKGDEYGVSASRRLGMLRNGGTITGAFGVSTTAMAAIEKLENSGTISGTTDGIAANKGLGTLSNLAGGTITGGQSGIAATAIDLLDNSGTIMGGSGAAVRVNKSASASGRLGRLVNRAGGRITSKNDHGVDAAAIGTLENNGMITGARDKSGLYARGTIGTLVNQRNGTISGGRNGIRATFIQTLSNHGTIRGSTGAGLAPGSGGRLENSGLITGGPRAHGIHARGAIDLLQNNGGGIIEGRIGVAIDPARAGATTIDNAGILRSLDGPPGVALVFGRQQGRERLILRDNFSLEGNILWDGRDDTLQYLSPRPALLTFTDNDAPARAEPTRFDVDAGGRPWLRSTRRSARFGQAETIISIFDPTLYTLGDAALSQWTGAIFQSLDRLPGPGAERPGPNRHRQTGPLDHLLWARPFGGLHRFKQDGPFVPPARHRFAGGLAGFSALGQRAGGGLFAGAAQSVIQVSGPARDEDSEHIFTGVWAGARIAEFDLDAAVLVGRGRYRSDWQRANNRVPGGRERVWSKYTGLFVSPELGLATRLEVKGVAVRPSLRLRYLGLFTKAHDYQTETSSTAGQAGGGQTALRINERGLHIGLARASLGFPLSFPANAHGGQLNGELRLGAEGRVRLSGDTVSALLGGQNVEFKASGGKAVTGFAGASFDYAVPALNLTFSADVEARYGSMADVGIHGQLGFMWAF